MSGVVKPEIGVKGVFAPNLTIPREQFVQILFNMEGQPFTSRTTIYFDDLVPGEWYADAVIWAKQNEIVYGIDNPVEDAIFKLNFGIGKEIDREQLIKILYDYAQFKKYDVTLAEGEESPIEKYSDKADVEEWAVKAVEWAVQKGLISGKKLNDETVILAPKDTATRAEAAQIIMKFKELYAPVDADKPDEGNTTPDEGNTTPDEGNTTTPDEGNTTTPDEGNTTTPDEGNTTTPDEGNTNTSDSDQGTTDNTNDKM